VNFIIHGLIFLILQDKYINLTRSFPFLMDDFKVKLLDEFLPISVRKVPSFEQVVPPLNFLPIMELHYAGKAFVHQDDFSVLLADSFYNKRCTFSSIRVPW
jgi:hypothetical protein